MTGRTRLWFVLFLLLVFATGAFSGVVLDRIWLVQRSRALIGDLRPGPRLELPGGGRRGGSAGPALIESQLARLGRQLELTADQRVALREILQRWNTRAGALQAEARQQYAEAQAALGMEIEAILTPEQVRQFRSTRGDIGGRRRGGGPPPRGR
jgi:hypothetical protein